MSWYSVIKTVKGRRYLYKQRTWREGKRVRTESVYVGSLDGGGRTPSTKKRVGVVQSIKGLIKANRTSPGERAQIKYEEEYLRQNAEREARDKKEREAD